MDTSEPKLSRKAREEAFRRDLILDAAESLFAEKGFDGTTVADIAGRAEFAKGSLYQLFESKEEIIAAAIRRKVDQIWATLDEILGKPISPVEKVREIMRTKLKAVWESRHFAQIFLHELRGFQWCMESPLLDDYRREIDTVMRKIEGLFAEGQREGQFRTDIPASTLLAAMAGFSNAIIHSWLNSAQGVDLETAIHEAEELFLHGVSLRKGSE